MPKFTEIPHHILKDFCLNAQGLIAVTPDASEYFTITTESEPTTGGTINPYGDGISALKGSTQTITFTPTEGYYISDVLIDDVSQGSITEYTFTNITENHSVDVTFEELIVKGTIGFTTQQMSTGGSQTLTVTGSSGGTYTWATTSGSISPSEGTSVTFTAPATNANCSSNPTITLTCGGAVVDTIQIAVNQVSGGGVGVRWVYLSQGSCSGSGSSWSIWNICANVYTLSCDGTVTFQSGWSPACSNGYGVDCDAAFDDGERKVISGLTGQTAYCYNQGVRFGDWCDSRSEAQKTAGCCPAQLL